MKPVRVSGRFKRDFRRVDRRGYALERLEAIVTALREDRELPFSLRPHALKGEWKGCLECHVAPDWLLIYRNTPTELQLVATGTHADLFDE